MAKVICGRGAAGSAGCERGSARGAVARGKRGAGGAGKEGRCRGWSRQRGRAQEAGEALQVGETQRKRWERARRGAGSRARSAAAWSVCGGAGAAPPLVARLLALGLPEQQRRDGVAEVEDAL